MAGVQMRDDGALDAVSDSSASGFGDWPVQGGSE